MPAAHGSANLAALMRLRFSVTPYLKENKVENDRLTGRHWALTFRLQRHVNMHIQADTRVHTYKHVHVHIPHTERMKERKQETGRRSREGRNVRRREGRGRERKQKTMRLSSPFVRFVVPLGIREEGLLLLLF